MTAEAIIGRGKSTHQYRASNLFTQPKVFAAPTGASQWGIALSRHAGLDPASTFFENQRMETPPTPLRQLSELEAYDAMRAFLEAYWNRGGQASDELAVLLGALNRDGSSDGLPIDAAQWSDWQDAVSTALEA